MINHSLIKDNEAEVVRLVAQERAIAWALGGLLPEHGTNQAAFVEPMQRVLDVPCGSGGWSIDMALAYPHLQIMGIDSNANMIDYARTQAQVGRLENASFTVMDARLSLDYPDNFFDLVSARWLSVIGRDAWPQVMSELFRVTRPGGFIRLTETEDVSVTTSPAFESLTALFLRASRLSGISFSPTGRSTNIAPKLPYFLRNAGFAHITKHALILDWSMGTDVYVPMVSSFNAFFDLLLPELAQAATREAIKELEQCSQKINEAIDELEQCYQTIDTELRAEDFCAWWTFYVIGAQKPHK